MVIALILLGLLMLAFMLIAIRRYQTKREKEKQARLAKGVVFTADASDYNAAISGLAAQASNPLYLKQAEGPAYTLASATAFPKDSGPAYEVASSRMIVNGAAAGSHNSAAAYEAASANQPATPAYALASAAARGSPTYALAGQTQPATPAYAVASAATRGSPAYALAGQNQPATPAYALASAAARGSPAYALAGQTQPVTPAYAVASAATRGSPAYALAGRNITGTPMYATAAPTMFSGGGGANAYMLARSQRYDVGMGDAAYDMGTVMTSPSFHLSPNKPFDEPSYNMATRIGESDSPAYEQAAAGGRRARFVSPSKPRMVTLNSSSKMPVYQLAQPGGSPGAAEYDTAASGVAYEMASSESPPSPFTFSEVPHELGRRVSRMPNGPKKEEMLRVLRGVTKRRGQVYANNVDSAHYMQPGVVEGDGCEGAMTGTLGDLNKLDAFYQAIADDEPAGVYRMATMNDSPTPARNRSTDPYASAYLDDPVPYAVATQDDLNKSTWTDDESEPLPLTSPAAGLSGADMVPYAVATHVDVLGSRAPRQVQQYPATPYTAIKDPRSQGRFRGTPHAKGAATPYTEIKMGGAARNHNVDLLSTTPAYLLPATPYTNIKEARPLGHSAYARLTAPHMPIIANASDGQYARLTAPRMPVFANMDNEDEDGIYDMRTIPGSSLSPQTPGVLYRPQPLSKVQSTSSLQPTEVDVYVTDDEFEPEPLAATPVTGFSSDALPYTEVDVEITEKTRVEELSPKVAASPTKLRYDTTPASANNKPLLQIADNVASKIVLQADTPTGTSTSTEDASPSPVPVQAPAAHLVFAEDASGKFCLQPDSSTDPPKMSSTSTGGTSPVQRPGSLRSPSTSTSRLVFSENASGRFCLQPESTSTDSPGGFSTSTDSPECSKYSVTNIDDLATSDHQIDAGDEECYSPGAGINGRYAIDDVVDAMIARAEAAVASDPAAMCCSVCSDDFQLLGEKVPHRLACGHVICQRDAFIAYCKTRKKKKELRCPVCKVVTKLGGDFSTLPKDEAVCRALRRRDGSAPNPLDGILPGMRVASVSPPQTASPHGAGVFGRRSTRYSPAESAGPFMRRLTRQSPAGFLASSAVGPNAAYQWLESPTRSASPSSPTGRGATAPYRLQSPTQNTMV